MGATPAAWGGFTSLKKTDTTTDSYDYVIYRKSGLRTSKTLILKKKSVKNGAKNTLDFDITGHRKW